MRQSAETAASASESRLENPTRSLVNREGDYSTKSKFHCHLESMSIIELETRIGERHMPRLCHRGWESQCD